jgi:hypothetical protein
MAEPSLRLVDKPFVNHYDQNAVDPSYGNRPLELFDPMIREDLQPQPEAAAARLVSPGADRAPPVWRSRMVSSALESQLL